MCISPLYEAYNELKHAKLPLACLLIENRLWGFHNFHLVEETITEI